MFPFTTLVTYFRPILSNFHNAWPKLPSTMPSGISSVAHHNPPINAIFVFLFMQELFIDKIHFFKFLCMSGKSQLHQLNVITSSRSSTVQAFLTAWIFSFVRGNTIKEGEIPYVENKYKTLPTYSIVSLVFRKFLYRTYQNGLNQVPQSWGTPSISKSKNRVSSIPFFRNLHFTLHLHRVQYVKYLQIFIYVSKLTGHHFPEWV